MRSGESLELFARLQRRCEDNRMSALDVSNVMDNAFRESIQSRIRSMHYFTAKGGYDPGHDRDIERHRRVTYIEMVFRASYEGLFARLQRRCEDNGTSPLDVSNFIGHAFRASH
jgi:hypothetical protein